MAEFEALKDYKPEKLTDFSVMKGTFKCVFNYARIEEYDGDNPDLQGAKFFRYELEIAQGEKNEGRRFWKSYNLANEDSLKKLADQLFTLGLEFRSEEELQSVAEKLVEMTVVVRAWGWTPDDADEARQMHIIKGIAKEKAERSKDSVPF